MNIKRALLALGAVIGLSTTLGFATSAQAQNPVCVPSNPLNTSWPPTNSTMTCSGTDPANFLLMRSTLEAIGNDGSDAAQRLRNQETAPSEQISITIYDDDTHQVIGTVGHITTALDTPRSIAEKLADNVTTQYSSDLFAYTQGDDVYIFTLTGHMISALSHQSGSNITLTVTAPSQYGVKANVAGVLRTDGIWWDMPSGPSLLGCTPQMGGCPVDLKPTALDNGVYGITWGGNVGSYTVVFDAITGGTTANSIIKHTTAHETGHQIDYLYGFVGMGGASGVPVSNTAAFKAAVQKDLDLMALMPACFFNASNGHNVYGDPPERTGGVYHQQDENGAPLSTGGLPGLFSWSADSEDNLICNDRTSNVAGANSVEIAKNAYPYFGGILASNQTAIEARERELFAEIYAALYAGGSGFPDTVDDLDSPRTSASDRLLTQSESFKCTKLYVYTITQLGRMPTEQELTDTWYSIPDIISDSPVDNGMYGYGETHFSCDGSTQYQGDYAWGA